jgi:hypothetical protein
MFENEDSLVQNYLDGKDFTEMCRSIGVPCAKPGTKKPPVKKGKGGKGGKGGQKRL